MPKGRPFQPGNQFGRGRPRGSSNKKTLISQELLDSHAEAVTRQALKLALKGDSQMLRILLGYLLPQRRDLPLKTGPLPMGSAAELSQASEKLIKRVTAGQISASEGLKMADLLEHRRHILETETLEMRLRALEQSVGKKTDTGGR